MWKNVWNIETRKQWLMEEQEEQIVTPKNIGEDCYRVSCRWGKKQIRPGILLDLKSRLRKNVREGKKENESHFPQEKNLHYIGNHKDPQLSFLLFSDKIMIS